MNIIDLSITIENDMDVYEGDPTPSIEPIHFIETHTWNLSKVTLGTHTGTHVDAFSHMHEGYETITDIEISRFIGQAQKVGVQNIYPKNMGLIFEEYIDEASLDKILEAKPLFVCGNISEHLERKLLKQRIITFTNLINLELLPLQTTFWFIGLPLKIKDGDGSPVRAVAILEDV